ncbi:MAG: hypothetical protein ACOY3D_04560 [Candidatus Omnitrophota bacterium]
MLHHCIDNIAEPAHKAGERLFLGLAFSNLLEVVFSRSVVIRVTSPILADLCKGNVE